MICVIGDSETVVGFALTGIKNVHEVSSSADAWSVYQKDTSKIIILSAEVSELIDMNKKDDRIVVKVFKSGEQKSDIKKIIKDAIGFDMSVD